MHRDVVRVRIPHYTILSHCIGLFALLIGTQNALHAESRSLRVTSHNAALFVPLEARIGSATVACYTSTGRSGIIGIIRQGVFVSRRRGVDSALTARCRAMQAPARDFVSFSVRDRATGALLSIFSPNGAGLSLPRALVEAGGLSVLAHAPLQPRERVTILLNEKRIARRSRPGSFAIRMGQEDLLSRLHHTLTTVRERRTPQGVQVRRDALEFSIGVGDRSIASLLNPAPSVSAPLNDVTGITSRISVSFSEPVIGFHENDIAVVGGAVNNFTSRTSGPVNDSYSTFTFDLEAVFPRGAERVEISFTIRDGAGIGAVSRLPTVGSQAHSVRFVRATSGSSATATPAPQPSVTRTPTPPSVSTSSPTFTPTPTPMPSVGQSVAVRLTTSSTNPIEARNSVPVTVTFSEAVRGVVERDFEVTGGVMNNFTAREPGSAEESYRVFVFDVSPSSSSASTAEVTVRLPAGRATGAESGLPNAAAEAVSLVFVRGTTALPTPTRTPSAVPSPSDAVSPTATPVRTPIQTPSGSGTTCSGALSSSPFALPVFPGAEGHGTLTTAGSGRHLTAPCTTVFRVTNLNDSGQGSLRECVEASGPRVCVFEVSGMIWATRPLRVVHPYLTIAGQTAPSPGIAIRSSGLRTEASDVLVQHIRFRVGDDPRAACCKTGTCSPSVAMYCTSDPGSRDGIATASTLGAPLKNIVYDHVSISWALDEGLSIVPDRADISDVTISNTIIGSGLDMSIHPEANTPGDLGHSKAVLVNGAKALRNLSFHHSLLAHNADRNIRIASPASMEYINNVVYNWGRGKGAGRLIEATNGVQALHLFDVIGNLYKAGRDTFCPDTTYRPEDCPIVASGGIDTEEEKLGLHYIVRVGNGVSNGLQRASRYFLQGNLGTTRLNFGTDEWDVAARSFYDSSGKYLLYPENRAGQPVASSGSVTVHDMSTALDRVLSGAGARPKDRDSVDQLLVEDVRNGTGQIINCVAPDGTQRCEKNAGGWPVYPVNRRPLALPAAPNLDDDSDGYTNLEEWLHEHARAVE